MAVKIGIISFAHLHAEAYAPALLSLPEAHLVGLHDDNPARGRAWAERLGVEFFPTREALLEQVEAVVITTENVGHRDATLAAAAAGVHVLCEKPLATTREDALAMIAACREAGVQLMISFPCRYSPAFLEAKRQVESGELGRILAMAGTNRGRNPGGWFTDPLLAGGGTVMDHTVHVVDLMRVLTGQEVVEVFCEKATVFQPDLAVEDCGLVSLRFADGTFATLDCSWSRPPHYPVWGDVTLTIIAEGGNLFLDLFSEHVDAYTNADRTYTWLDYGHDVNRSLLADFLACLQTGRPVPVTGEDGLRAMEVALAAYEAARRGVPVPLHQCQQLGGTRP